MKYFFSFILCCFVFFSKAEVAIDKIINISDTISLTMSVDSIENFENKTRYTYEFIYSIDYFEFIGLDSTKTLIPESGITIAHTIYNETDHMYKTTIEADNDSKKLLDIDPSAKTWLSVLFKPVTSFSKQLITSETWLYSGLNGDEYYNYTRTNSFTVFPKANFTIANQVCSNDTLTIDILVDSIPNFDNKTICEFQCYYDTTYFEFIQVDSSKTIIPESGFTIQKYVADETLLEIEAEGLTTPLIQFDLDATSVFSLKFKALQPGNEIFFMGILSYYPSDLYDNTSQYESVPYVSYIKIDATPEIEIMTQSIDDDTQILLTEPGGFTSYSWTYLKNNYTTSKISVQGSGAYSVITTDNNGCKGYDTLEVNFRNKYVAPTNIEACTNDTIYITIYIDSIGNYRVINSYNLDYSYTVGYYDYIGIDSSQTIIPPSGLDITFNDLETGVIYVQVAADLGEQTFYELDTEASTLITLMFTTKQEFDSRSFGYLSVETTSNAIINHHYSIQTLITIFDSPLEINEPEVSDQGKLIVSTIGSYNDYSWSYKETYNSDYAFDNFSYSDSSANFIGSGLYSVWATDEHGCHLSNEIHLEYNGVFAKGIVTAKDELYADGTVSAYLKTDEGFNLEQQTNIENGEYLFPATLSSGKYVFYATPNKNEGFLPTYYGNEFSIDNAFVVNLEEYDGVVGLDIDLISEEEMENTKSSPHTDSSKINCDFLTYPNPVSDILHIEPENICNIINPEIIIYNSLGAVVYQEKYNGNVQTINIQHLKTGIYFVKINNRFTKIFKE